MCWPTDSSRYIKEHMINDRPESDYMAVAPTNIRIYCFLVDLPVGHFNYTIPRSMTHGNYIEDVLPPSRDNLCLFRCIVKQFRPEESLADHEKREIDVVNL